MTSRRSLHAFEVMGAAVGFMLLRACQGSTGTVCSSQPCTHTYNMKAWKISHVGVTWVDHHTDQQVTDAMISDAHIGITGGPDQF